MGIYGIWNLEFWENSNGNSPAEESFSKMIGKDRDLEKGIVKSVKQLRRYSVEQMSMTKRLEKVEGGLSELKISTVKKEVRFLGVFRKGHFIVFYALHVFLKKSQKIPQKEIKTAQQRLKEYKLQNHEI